jgi:DNA-binding response OmpR family regulator
LNLVHAGSPDLLVLDLGLPDIDGVAVCENVRGTSGVPILVLSARGREADKVRALDAGADDYVTKPFGSEELLARIRAALRRADSASAPQAPFVCGGLTIDRQRFRVERDGEDIHLTPKEFELLSLLAANAGRVAHAPGHPAGDLGPERRRTAGTSARAGRRPAEEDRARSVVAAYSSPSPGSATGSRTWSP